MIKKEQVTLKDLFTVLDLIERTGIAYWLDGGWGVDALIGKQTREHRDVDINFDAQYTEQLLKTLKEYNYEVETDQSPVRVELHHRELGYLDIHPFVLLDGGKARQADLDGGWYESDADFFRETILENRKIPCISAKGQMVFHTGYELRDVDEHDIENIKKALERTD